MSLQITPQGINIQTFDEIFDALAQGYRDIYGADIDISQNTADGQRIGIHAKAVHDLQTSILELYNGWDVEKAQGVQLDRLSAFCGITRRPATKSSWDVTVTASRATLLYSGYIMRDDAGQEWLKRTEVNLTAGDTLVTFEAKEFGAVQGLALATLEQVTVIPEITALVPAGSASTGVDEETDFELRTRRLRSLQNPAFSTVGALTAKLLDLKGVTDVFIYENKTSVANQSLDLGPHSIWVIVEGGEISAIAETMAKQKTAGTGEKGDVVGLFVETLPNGFEITHEMTFQRPTIADLHIRVDATAVTDNPIDVELIKQNLVAQKFTIAQTVEAYKLYPIAGNGLTGNAYLANLEISSDGITFTDGTLDPVSGGKFVITDDNITINAL